MRASKTLEDRENVSEGAEDRPYQTLMLSFTFWASELRLLLSALDLLLGLWGQ